MENSDDLISSVREKIQYGETLVLKLEPFRKIDGMMKLQRKVKQEIEFLRRLQKSNKVKKEQLCCSNLRHLGALVECSLRSNVVAVCKIFHIDEQSKLLVDIISDEGKTWTKVIARNPKSLSALSSGNASYGARSILDQARDYLNCARLYPCMYQAPKVIFQFESGIEAKLAHKLKALGITLRGDILPATSQDSQDVSDSDHSKCSEDEESDLDTMVSQEVSQCFQQNPEIDTLNLDVTAMMAYISNMTNGHCNYIFNQEVLTQQCSWESERPVRPALEKLFQGKKLICCRTAWDDFEKIVSTLGGASEIRRAAELKTKLVIFPDDFGGEDDYPRCNLKVRGNVRLRSKLIFNFGHRMKALTVSANEGFVRAAQQQGVSYAAFIHESRALTEGKEGSATKISLS